MSTAEAYVNSPTLNFKDVPIRELNEEDLKFIRRWTGGKFSDEELRNNITTIHNEVINGLHVYKCISTFSYLIPRSVHHPYYNTIVEKAKEAGNAYKILDIGCCYGQETRSLIANGISPSSMIVTDLVDDYWKAGMKVYMDEQLQPNRINEVQALFGDFAVAEDELCEDLRKIQHESIDAIMCMAIFHVLSKTQTAEMVRQLYTTAITECVYTILLYSYILSPLILYNY